MLHNALNSNCAHILFLHHLQKAPSKPKRKRISQEQFQRLSELFEQTDTPNYELREKLAAELNMTNREVQVNECLKIFRLAIWGII